MNRSSAAAACWVIGCTAPVTTMLVSSWNSTCATSGPPDPAATAVLTLL